MDNFEQWARGEISRLRDEATQLETVLAKFLSSVTAPTANPVHPLTSRLNGSEKGDHSPSMGFVERLRSTKNDAILEAIVRAGPVGMNLDEIVDAATHAGIKSGRNAIRAFCWNEKQRGRLIAVEYGRYASAKFAGLRPNESRQTNEAADPAGSGESAASVPSTPNDAERRGEVAHDNMTT